MRGLLHPDYYSNPWRRIDILYINLWLDVQFRDLVAFQVVYDGWPYHGTDADHFVRIDKHGE
jgi:hypothetical protein